ncbi:MAG: hypothetical protein ACM34M_01325, partial [Ignavibacteria bacterium]
MLRSRLLTIRIINIIFYFQIVSPEGIPLAAVSYILQVCFVTRRAREVDQRSFCKQGSGGTSTVDALSF